MAFSSSRISRVLAHLQANSSQPQSCVLQPAPTASNSGSFVGRLCLVTGGSRGIGAETVRQLSSRGATVAIQFRADKASALLTRDLAIQNLLPFYGGDQTVASQQVQIFQAELSDVIQVKGLVENVLKAFGRPPDVLVNNAGVYKEIPISDSTNFDDWAKTWNKTIDLNLSAVAHLSFLIAKAMVHSQVKKGAIVNVSSRGAFRGEPDAWAYAASKGGLNSLSQSMALTLGKYGISVTCVAPGFVQTEMARKVLESDIGDAIRAQSPFGRVATAGDVAATIVFLAEPERTFLSGGIVDVNGASFLRM